MEPRARSAASRILLLVLVPCALASIVGGGLIVAERQGLVTLRRVPSVFLLPTWQDANGGTVAIVNTDVTAGAFLLARDEEPSRPQQVWVPARSFVLRSVRDATDSGFRLYHARVPDESKAVFHLDRSYREAPRFVPRGTVAPIEWVRRVPNPSKVDFFQILKAPGVSLVPAPGLTLGMQWSYEGRSSEGSTWDVAATGLIAQPHDLTMTIVWARFMWDGAMPVMVSVDSTTPAPSVFQAWAEAGENRKDFWSRFLVIHDPDMTVIDERSDR